MAKHSGGPSRLVISLAAIVAFAGIPATASAETRPDRPSPSEKPAADGAKPQIKVLQSSAVKPDVPAPPPGATRVRALSPAERQAFFKTDTGGAYMTLRAGKLDVPGRGSLALFEPFWVSSHELQLKPPKGALILSLQGPPKKTYFVDIAFHADSTGPCKFEIRWPDSTTDHVACHGKNKQHLLFGVQTPAASPGMSGGSTFIRITPKHGTTIYEIEVTAK